LQALPGELFDASAAFSATEVFTIACSNARCVLHRLHVSQARFAADQDAVLAEAVINSERAVEPLTPDERVVRDCDEYLGSIMMDGHLLTFSNNGPERVNEFSNSLDQVAATRELALLREALRLWEEHGYADHAVAEDALHNELDALDQQFFEAGGAEDSLDIRTKKYVFDHLDGFIILE